ncbi:hypothetical protein NQ315_002256 [Exocentrus adspersus]|uniref:Peroxisome assembly protein 12 n=1 Tax=Exocentrus adspersus TaxID=1586481 RepID=A0AAV8VSY1_9CUCU|nr:hypothetical protein NQ315_002256 [Exocentrus adspersus]
MAENAANFTFTFQTRPSIFEIVAQKSFNDTLHPALQKIALFLADNFPHKFNWLNKYYEEAFLVLNGLLQYHYLKYYDASFSENFYGLKRVPGNDTKLSKHHRELSLIFLVALPYFKRKMEERITVIRIENAEGYLKQDFEGRLKKLLLHSHSALEVAWGLVVLQNYLKYMSGKEEFQTPILRLIDVKLTYSLEQQEVPGFWAALFKGNLSFSELSFGLVRNAVTTFLEVTAFFLQFLHAWNAQKSNYNVTDLPVVAPPQVDNRAKNYQGKCPVCLKQWIIPSVLPVSGYIFCFRCIWKHLSENAHCPVTRLPARPQDIVRLYLN